MQTTATQSHHAAPHQRGVNIESEDSECAQFQFNAATASFTPTQWNIFAASEFVKLGILLPLHGSKNHDLASWKFGSVTTCGPGLIAFLAVFQILRGLQHLGTLHLPSLAGIPCTWSTL